MLIRSVGGWAWEEKLRVCTRRPPREMVKAPGGGGGGAGFDLKPNFYKRANLTDL